MSAIVPLWWTLTVVGVLGLAVGSFLNVVVYRVPAGISVMHPPSACPGCGHVVRARDNVPVLSWLLLRGRCRDCSMAISGRYPLVEALTGAAFLAAAWRFDDPLLLGVVLIVVGAGIALAIIDLEHLRLPDVVTGAAAVLVAAALVAGTLAGHAVPWLSVVGSAALWGGVYGLLWFASAGAWMGLGDVKLAPVLGAAVGLVGLPASVVGLFGGFVLGALVLVPLRSSGRVGRGTPVPHGPFLLAGAVVALFAGKSVVDGYLTFIDGLIAMLGLA